MAFITRLRRPAIIDLLQKNGLLFINKVNLDWRAQMTLISLHEIGFTKKETFFKKSFIQIVICSSQHVDHSNLFWYDASSISAPSLLFDTVLQQLSSPSFFSLSLSPFLFLFLLLFDNLILNKFFSFVQCLFSSRVKQNGQFGRSDAGNQFLFWLRRRKRRKVLFNPIIADTLFC